MGRKYNRPPLVEAVCEFRLSDATKWDLTVTGLLYEKVKADFPIIEQRRFSALEIEQSLGGIKQKTNNEDRALFFNESRTAFIQVGTRMLAVNCLAPYPEWTGFCRYIDQAFSALNKINPVKGVNRLGLRYINRIEIPNEAEKNHVQLDTYFDFRPELGKHLPQDMVSFMLGATLPFENDICRVVLTGTLAEQPDHQAFSLDLDYSTANEPNVPPAKIDEWIDAAHHNLETVFEGCIKDSLRILFEEVK